MSLVEIMPTALTDGATLDALETWLTSRLGEVDATHLKQPRAQIELRRVAGTGCLLALGGFAIVSVQQVQLGLDLGVALRQLRGAEVERVSRFFHREFFAFGKADHAAIRE